MIMKTMKQQLARARIAAILAVSLLAALSMTQGRPAGGDLPDGGWLTFNPDLWGLLGFHCPCAGPSGTDQPWQNHGEYLACVKQEIDAIGFISAEEKRELVSRSAQSTCGKK
jgi:hypothetical protein